MKAVANRNMKIEKMKIIIFRFLCKILTLWKIKLYYSIFSKEFTKKIFFMIRKDQHFNDKILPAVAILDKNLKIFIFIFFSLIFSFLIFLSVVAFRRKNCIKLYVLVQGIKLCFSLEVCYWSGYGLDCI